MSKPRDNKEVKERLSVRLEPWAIEKVKAEFPQVSTGINIIVMDWISRNCKLDTPVISEREKELESILADIKSKLP